MPATSWAARLGGLVRAGPSPTWAAFPLQDAALLILELTHLAKLPERESELPLSEAFLIALFLCSILAVVFVWGVYWF